MGYNITKKTIHRRKWMEKEKHGSKKGQDRSGFKYTDTKVATQNLY